MDTECPLEDQIFEMGYILISKEKGSYRKAQRVLDVLNEISLKYDIKHVFIEENLQTFRTGLSSAKTLATLARFNGIVSYLCEEVFIHEPNFLNVNNARRQVGMKIIRKSKGGKPTKEQVIDWVHADILTNSHLDYQWKRKILKSGPRKGVSILDPVCYDMADAYVIARAGQMNISHQTL
jgi:hypothetical protein